MKPTFWQIDERSFPSAAQSQTFSNGVRRAAGRNRTLKQYWRGDVADYLGVESEPVEFTDDGIAIVYVEGVLTTRPEDSWSLFGADYDTLGKVCERLLAGPVMPVIFRFDSPGGHAIGVDRIAELVALLAESRLVVAHCVNQCCSAAYRIASQCGTIIATADTEVGSIGTMWQMFDYSKMFEMEGVRSVLLKSGAFKGLGAIGEELTAEHEAFLQARVDELSSKFVADVKRGRGFSDEQAAAVSDGRWYSAGVAQGLGLVDWIASFEDVLAAVRQTKGLDMTKATLAPPAAGGGASAGNESGAGLQVSPGVAGAGGVQSGTDSAATSAAAGAGADTAAAAAAPVRGLAEYMAAFGDGAGAVMFRDGLTWEQAQAKTIENLRAELTTVRGELSALKGTAATLGKEVAGGTDPVNLGREEKAASLSDAFRKGSKR